MDRTENTLEQDMQTCFQAMQAMDNAYESYARKNGLTYMSLYILETIYEKNGCTQKQIAEITLYPKQTVHMVIRSFIEKGWVVLEQTQQDRRNKHVRLTESGELFARQIIEPYWEAGQRAFSELGAETRGIMTRALKNFVHSFAEKTEQL